MTDFSGKVLANRYRVDQFLGRGGMADVYKVQDLQRAAPLALKILHDDLVEDATFLQRFEREARTLGMLQHPNIVRFYGLEKAGGLAFILMDYIDGLTLRKEIQLSKGGLHPARILEVLQPVCSALFYAHRKGMVHCDIKPANIMIHRNGAVYLTDFGIARVNEDASTVQAGAQLASGAGTPAYMAPEQIEGHEPTETMDIYALGVVLFEMLTGGQRPFSGDTPGAQGTTTQNLVWEKRSLPAPSPRRYNPSVSPEFECIVTRCLHRDPDQRFSNTLDLLHALEVALRGGDDTVLTRSKVTKPPIDQRAPGPLPAKRRLPAPWMAALGAALLVGGLLIFTDSVRAPAAEPTRLAAAGAVRLEAPSNANTYVPTSAGRATAIPMGTAAAGEAAPSPTPQPTPIGGSRWIAFASDRGGTVQIWILDVENPEKRRQITDIEGGACQPAWSPDGMKIAFTSPCIGPSQFYIGSNIKIADVASRAITDLHLPKNTFDPAWSPDGSTLLYTALVIEQTELHALNLANQQVRVLSNRGSKNVHGAWSRDGAHVVFVTSDIQRRDALWMIGREGDSPEIVNEAAVFAEPVFSPDGSHILASVHHGSKVPYLALVARDDPTMAETRLLDESYAQHHGSFSPDGRWVVFWSEVTIAGKGEILIMEMSAKFAEAKSAEAKSAGANLAGAGSTRTEPALPRQLTTNNQRDFQPAWSP